MQENSNAKEIENSTNREKEKSVKTAPSAEAPLLGNNDAVPYKGGRFKRFINKLSEKFTKHEHIFWSFFTPILVMFVVYAFLGVYPFGRLSVLVLDSSAQYVFFFSSLRRAVFGDASILYSFSRSLGGEFMGIYAYYVASPLSYIVCLFPEDMMMECMEVLFLLKAGLCGATFAWYLSKTTHKFEKKSIVFFSVLYALCSYAVVMQHNTMWIDAMIWLPLLTYSIEQMMKYGKYKLFVISLSLSILSNFYIGYMICFYVVIYTIYYYVANSENNRINPTGEKYHFLHSFVRIIFWSILSICISAVIILTIYYSLQFGKTTFTTTNWSWVSRFDWLDLLAKFFIGSYDTVRPEGLPFVYCGIMPLILIPIFFVSKKFTRRERISAGCLIAVFLLLFVNSPLDIVMHGLQKPNWLNYRYSFMLSFVILIFAYRAFCEIEKVSSKMIIAISAFLSFILLVIQKFDYKYVGDFSVVLISLGFIVLYTILLCMLPTAKKKKAVLYVIIGAICLETFANGLINLDGLNSDVVYSKTPEYYEFKDTVQVATDQIRANDKSFYRAETENHRKICDNMMLGIKGIQHSTSTLNASTISALRALGYSSESHWSEYKGGNPVSDSLIGIKYIVSSKDHTNFYDAAYTNGDLMTYVNPYALSLAYAVSSDLLSYDPEDDFSGFITPFEYLNSIITLMLGESRTVEVFKYVDVANIKTNNVTASHVATHEKYVPINPDTESTVTLSYDIDKDAEYFFYFPSEYPRTANLYINNKSSGTFGDTHNRFILSAGQFEEGDTLNIKLKLGSDSLYFKNADHSLYYIDWDVFTDAMTRLAEHQLIIDDNCPDDHITGKINSANDQQLVFTTIPYDEGWKVYVDGQRVDIQETLDAFISFYVNEGEHTVEMRYMPNCFVIGLVITLFSGLLFILIWIFEKKLYSTRFGKTIFCTGEIIYPEEIHGEETAEKKKSDKSEVPNDEEEKEKEKNDKNEELEEIFKDVSREDPDKENKNEENNGETKDASDEKSDSREEN